MSDATSYRIGWWTHRWWPTAGLLGCLLSGRDPQDRRTPRRHYVKAIVHRLRLIRRPHRPWQAEADGSSVRFARRSFTRAGAERKALRDALAATEGRRTPYQQYRWLRARRWDRRNLPGGAS